MPRPIRAARVRGWAHGCRVRGWRVRGWVCGRVHRRVCRQSVAGKDAPAVADRSVLGKTPDCKKTAVQLRPKLVRHSSSAADESWVFGLR
ncbi:unnamed protein product [Merluccius merluccius]